MESMSDIDWSHLDARLLRGFVAVFEAGSVTAAAQRLDVTQSAVSHLLDRLRAITGDALFVKSGRGIVPTARAQALAAEARELLERLQAFARHGEFDPARWRATFTIAANDFQRDVLLPALAARLRAQAPGVALRILASDVPTLDLLRDGQCHLVVSPRPPDGGDVLQQRLFADRYRVFYDAGARAAPAGRADYLAADHATVVYAGNRPLALDAALEHRGIARRFAVMLPGFAGLPAFLRANPLLATAPGLLGEGLLRGFASVPVPVPCPPIAMYMLWHQRHRHDPAHGWLRAQITALAAAVRGGMG
ncbi:LysR family transcriptional regulator [Pseudorhodoferax sp.]|uniref:LysR family transcriptional regulator n=1 Tax=Pseudorhodoferax sp. TaxID=1993553 RepID=UPI0039E56DEE